MKNTGVTFTLSHTIFAGGLLSGEGSHSWDHSGKTDALLRLDGMKFGLWSGFGISTHAELNHGASNQSVGGTLLPNNTAALFPASKGTVADLSLYVTQQLSETSILMLGKINTVDLYAAGREFSGGRGVELFQHLEFAGPITGITPPMLFGGLVSIRTTPAKFTLMIYDPVATTMRSGLTDPFGDGVTFNGSVEMQSNFNNQSGKHFFSTAYSTQDGRDFSDPNLLLPSQPVTNKDDRWFLSYAFEQTLWRNPQDPKKAWGLFGQVGFSDGNPNAVQRSFLGGIGGTSPINGRGRDKFGVGLFYVGFSDDLKDAIQPVIRLRDEYGAEFFYNFSVTPWLRVTLDLQIIQPGQIAREPAVVGGLRTQVIF